MPGLDINWFREDKGFNPDVIRKSLERRFRNIEIVDQIIANDSEWRKSKYLSIPARYELDMLNKEWNALGEAIKQKKKANKNDPCEEELQKKKEN